MLTFDSFLRTYSVVLLCIVYFVVYIPISVVKLDILYSVQQVCTAVAEYYYVVAVKSIRQQGTPSRLLLLLVLPPQI